ncbi:MAG: dTDP-4-dehydrorhamnose 3,5-epimerase family protein [Bryobacteraceae bacterium]
MHDDLLTLERHVSVTDDEELASYGDLRLAIPRCQKGIDSIILAPDSHALIDGVRVRSFPIWPDDRGYFLEVMRTGLGLTAGFDLTHSQVSAALSYPGTIKAFHYHLRQTDCWVTTAGLLQVALVDLRKDSPTYGRRNTMYVGALRPWQVMVPPGVAHGYKVIGRDSAVLVYVTNQVYDPKDEGRIAHNHPSLQYDWELQYK